MIAVVEDHRDTAEAMTRLLERHGIPAVAHECGPDLLEALERGARPKLIVLDVEMPRMDGIECLRALGGDERFRHIPVIMLSATFNDRVIRQALALGAREYVVKGTMGWNRLLELIRKHAGVEAD